MAGAPSLTARRAILVGASAAVHLAAAVAMVWLAARWADDPAPIAVDLVEWIGASSGPAPGAPAAGPALRASRPPGAGGGHPPRRRAPGAGSPGPGRRAVAPSPGGRPGAAAPAPEPPARPTERGPSPEAAPPEAHLPAAPSAEPAEPSSAITDGPEPPAPVADAEVADRLEEVPGGDRAAGDARASAGSHRLPGDPRGSSGVASPPGSAGAPDETGGEGGGGPSSHGLAGGGAAAGGRAGSADYGPYLRLFRQRVQDSLRYPLAARRRGLAGQVELEVVLEPTGRVRSVRVLSSSTHRMLDDAAVASIAGMAPVPLPPELSGRPLQIRVPLRFELR